MLFTPSVAVEGECLVFQPWLFKKRAALDSIVQIEGVKRDMLTHEENYLLLFLDDGRMFWLGQLDPGFESAEAKLRERFPSLDFDWMGLLERDNAGTRTVLWNLADVATKPTPRLGRARRRLGLRNNRTFYLLRRR